MFADLWQGIKDSVGAFISNPLLSLSDPAAAALEYRIKQKIAAGETNDQIKKDLTDAGFQKGSPIVDVINGAGASINFLFKNLPLILILAIVVLVLMYVVPVFRKVNA